MLVLAAAGTSVVLLAFAALDAGALLVAQAVRVASVLSSVSTAIGCRRVSIDMGSRSPVVGSVGSKSMTSRLRLSHPMRQDALHELPELRRVLPILFG